MSDTFEDIAVSLTKEGYLAQALNMDRTEMYNSWTRNIAAAIKRNYDGAVEDPDTTAAYRNVLANCPNGDRNWSDWEAWMLALKGLTPQEALTLVGHGFIVSELVVACWAVEDGADRLRKFIVEPRGGSR